MNYKRLTLCLLLAAFILTPLAAKPAIQKHVIREVEYTTDRYTRESALKRELNIAPGRAFDSREELIKYLEDKAQHLMNLRVLEEVRYSYEITDSTETETGYLVAFQIKGSWSIYPIIYPKYDSNTGFRIGSQTYYDNFFGTLTKFYLGGNIDFRKEGETIRIPQWSLNPRISNINIWGMSFSVNLFQQYETITKYDADTKSYIEDYSLHSTSLDVGTSFKLPFDFSYSMSPSFTWSYGYNDNLPEGGSGIAEENLQFSWSHSVGYGSLNWKGNFREGWALGIGNTLSLAREPNTPAYFKSTVSGNVTAFAIWKRLNPSIRVRGIYSFNDELSGLGSGLRGIRDEDMYGIAHVYANTSLNISVIPWKGVGEAQFQPFFDIGVARKENLPMDVERDMKYSSGADFILYLDKLKSLVARGSIGIDLTNPDWSDGRKYEISIESSLHY